MYVSGGGRWSPCRAAPNQAQQGSCLPLSYPITTALSSTWVALYPAVFMLLGTPFPHTPLVLILLHLGSVYWIAALDGLHVGCRYWSYNIVYMRMMYHGVQMTALGTIVGTSIAMLPAWSNELMLSIGRYVVLILMLPWSEGAGFHPNITKPQSHVWLIQLNV